MNTKRITQVLLTLLFSITGIVMPVAAHGDGEQLEIYRIPVADYYVSVWSLPGVLRTGEVHFETAVFNQNYEPVTDCDIKILLSPVDAPDQAIELQTRVPTQETLYRHEIEHMVTTADEYQITVLLTDPAGNEGQTEFQVEVIEVPLWIKIPLYISMVIAVSIGLLLLKQGLVVFGLWKPKQVNKPALKRPAN